MLFASKNRKSGSKIFSLKFYLYSDTVPMTLIKNIIFDFGNVLFDLDLPAVERNLRPLFGNSFDSALEKLRRDKVFELYETGGISTEEFVDTIRFSVQPALSAAQVQAVWNSIFIEMPRHRFDMLLQLRQQYKVFLLSNINDLHERWIAEYMPREHGIADYESRYFDGVYFSHLIRLRKPDRAIYEYVLADAEILPEETVFFDDVEANIEAAKAVGIRGVLHPVGMEIGEHVEKVLGESIGTS
jgi:FMN phosphatase YigB (HAD superfamily)